MKLKRLFHYYKYLADAKLQITLAILSGVVYGVSTGAGIPLLCKELFPKLLDTRGLTPTMVIMFSLLPVTVAFLRASANYLNTYYLGYCGQHLTQKLRLLVFRKIQYLPLSYFNKTTPGDIIQRTTGDTAAIQNSIIQFAQDAVKQPITLLGTLGTLLYLCYQQTDIIFLIFVILAIPLAIIPIRVLGSKLRKRAHNMQAQGGHLTQKLTQNLTAIKEIRSFCMEESETNKYEKAYDFFAKMFMKTVKYNAILTPVIEVLSTIGVGFTFYYTYTLNISTEFFVAAAIALYLMYEPIKKIGRLSNQLQIAFVSLERVEEVLNEPETIKDPENPVEVGGLKGNIEYRNVNFHYEQDEPVLINLSETLPAGRTYALVGPSGAGKTTFTYLLPRFYDAVSGIISIDGVPINKMRLHDLRNNIAVVSQDPKLFNDTIYNNILVGKPEATKEEVIEAAKKAFAHDFIQTFPKGYDSNCGEDGTALSGGQKQRIAIARAFLKNAPILILDEATSALDSASEEYIQQALANLFKGKTVIAIAHRFSSIKHADEILVFQKGHIVERGGHEELMENAGVYKALYDKQFKRQDDNVFEENAAEAELILN